MTGIVKYYPNIFVAQLFGLIKINELVRRNTAAACLSSGTL